MGRVNRPSVTSDEVKARRVETGRSMEQCKTELLAERRAEWLETSIESFRQTGDRDLLADVLVELSRIAH